MKTYFALVHKDPDSIYGVSFPDVPGCTSAGETYEEAIANAAEALRLHFDVSTETGAAFPEARVLDRILADPDVKENIAGSSVVGVPLTSSRDPMIEIRLSLEPQLIDAIDDAARRRGLTRSAFLAKAARAELAE